MKIKEISPEEAIKYIGKEIFFWTDAHTHYSNIYKAKLIKVDLNYTYKLVIDRTEKLKLKTARTEKCIYLSAGDCFEKCGIEYDSQLQLKF